MSVSNLLVPNNFNLFANNLTVAGTFNQTSIAGSASNYTQLTSNATAVPITTQSGIVTMQAPLASGLTTFTLTGPSTLIPSTGNVFIVLEAGQVSLISFIPVSFNCGVTSAGVIQINLINNDASHTSNVAPKIYYKIY